MTDPNLTLEELQAESAAAQARALSEETGGVVNVYVGFKNTKLTHWVRTEEQGRPTNHDVGPLPFLVRSFDRGYATGGLARLAEQPISSS